jgi:hypothetical protein
LLRSPGPCSPSVFRSAICDCLSLINVSFTLFPRLCGGGAPGLGRSSPGRGPGAGSPVFGCVRGPGGAGGGGLSGRWVVRRCAGRCRVRRLPAVVFRGLSGGLSPFFGLLRAYRFVLIVSFPTARASMQFLRRTHRHAA